MEMEFIDVEKLLGGGRNSEEEHTPPLPEALIQTLEEVCERYQNGCPFKVGDLVTPRTGYALLYAGHPNIVVETPWEPIVIDKDSNHGSHTFGVRLDMRVAHWSQGEIVMHWVESWVFERYDPKKED